MLVQRVLTPDLSLDSWTVLGDGGPVEPIERYLAYLSPDAGCVDGVVDRSHTPSVGPLLHFERFQVIFVLGAPEPHVDDVAGIEVVDVLGQF